MKLINKGYLLYQIFEQFVRGPPTYHSREVQLISVQWFGRRFCLKLNVHFVHIPMQHMAAIFSNQSIWLEPITYVSCNQTKLKKKENYYVLSFCTFSDFFFKTINKAYSNLVEGLTRNICNTLKIQQKNTCISTRQRELYFQQYRYVLSRELCINNATYKTFVN